MHLTPINYIQERFRFDGKDEEVLNRDNTKLSEAEKDAVVKNGTIIEVHSRVIKKKILYYQCKLQGQHKLQMIDARSVKDDRELKLFKAFDEKLAAEAAGNDRRPLTNENIIPFLKDFGLPKEFAMGEVQRLSGGQRSKLGMSARSQYIATVTSQKYLYVRQKP